MFLTNPVLQYVALEISAEADGLEILLVQPKATPGVNITSRPVTINPCTDVVCILEGHETLAELQAMYSITQRDMVSYLMSKVDMFRVQIPCTW